VATKKPKKPITDQIATAQNDITMNYIGKTLLNPEQDFKLTKGFLMGDGILKERRFLTG